MRTLVLVLLVLLIANTVVGNIPKGPLEDSLRWQTAYSPDYMQYRKTHAPTGFFTQHFINFLNSQEFKQQAEEYLPKDYDLKSAIKDLIGEKKMAQIERERHDVKKRVQLFSDVIMSSFGGFREEKYHAEYINQHPAGTTHNDPCPLVAVNGIGMAAGDMSLPLYHHYLRRKEDWGGHNLCFAATPTHAEFHKGFIVDDIIQVRLLIFAVGTYTGRKVDILAFSFGVPTTLAAIQGGEMMTQVPGNESSVINEKRDIGQKSLKDIVHVLVGVAGLVHGTQSCHNGLIVQQKSIAEQPHCDKLTGVCYKSLFLSNLRAKGYTAHSIHADPDTAIGNKQLGPHTLNHDTSWISGQNGESFAVLFLREEPEEYVGRWNHLEVLMKSTGKQSEFFGVHPLTPPPPITLNAKL